MRIGQNVKNGFINSKFDYWQRVVGNSTSFATGGYTADRWRYGQSADGGTAALGSIQRQVPAVGLYDDQNYFMRLTNTTQGTSLGANSVHYLAQRIEDVRSYAGKKVIASFWLSSTISSKQIAFIAGQDFGSGGSSLVRVAGTTKTISGTMTRYDVEFNIPSISGKTIGTNSFLEIGIVFQMGATFAALYGLSAVTWQGTGDIDILKSMITVGELTSLPEYEMSGRNLAHELLFCQRYYEKSYNIETAPGTSSVNGIVASGGNTSNGQGAQYNGAHHAFKATKRTTPIITRYDYVGNADRISTLSTTVSTRTDNITPTVIVGSGASQSGLFYGDATAINTMSIWHYTADAEF